MYTVCNKYFRMPGTLTIGGVDIAIPSEVLFFLERLLEDANIKPTNDELRRTMMQELAGRLQQQLVLDLLNKLPEGKFDEFEQLMSGNPTQDRVMLFLKMSVPQSDNVISQSLLEFKDVFLANANP